MKEYLEKVHKRIAELDRRYPNRYRTIHKTACKNCPSVKGTDPENEDFKLLPKQVVAEKFLFVCGWRNSRLCKGLCDSHGIDQEFLNKLHKQ